MEIALVRWIKALSREIAADPSDPILLLGPDEEMRYDGGARHQHGVIGSTHGRLVVTNKRLAYRDDPLAYLSRAGSKRDILEIDVGTIDVLEVEGLARGLRAGYPFGRWFAIVDDRGGRHHFSIPKAVSPFGLFGLAT